MPATQANASNEDLARWIWTMAIIGFFAVQASLWLVAITLTFRDPSFAVTDQYEQKGQEWDAIAARQIASQKLGWSLEFYETPGGDGKNAGIQIRLIDRVGRPVSGASIELSVFHCARASEVQTPPVRDIGDGVYLANARIDRRGKWKLSGVARLDETEFWFDRKQEFMGIGESP